MRKLISILLLTFISLVLFSCSRNKNNDDPLDPNKPATIVIWHYYNGTVKDKFDTLVYEFNETVGMDRGVVVEAKSYGDVHQLAVAVNDSASGVIGAQLMPDIFASYPDNAFRVFQHIGLVDFNDYLSQDELQSIRKEFLMEGVFGNEEALRILPIAKSTENLYLNKTFWDEFSRDTGIRIEKLRTWEGLLEVAEMYFNYSGKAFLSIDAIANYFLISSMQLGEELYTYEADRAILNFSEERAYKIWENYYVPHLKGYAKVGNVIAYTGSTAGAAYFPKEVAINDESIPIEVITLPYPYYENGTPYAIQQGAGMCITKSDTVHEYGAALFLKWFIEKKQNVEFAVATGYFPVKNESLKEDVILKELDINNSANKAIRQSINTTIDMMEDYKFYGNRPFIGSYDVRQLFENHLFKKIQSDLELLNKRISNGENKTDVIEEYISKDEFNQWYQEFVETAKQILNKN